MEWFEFGFLLLFWLATGAVLQVVTDLHQTVYNDRK
jgi:hypothetical protein